MADGTLFGNLSTTRVIDLFCGAGGTSLGVEMGNAVVPQVMAALTRENLGAHRG